VSDTVSTFTSAPASNAPDANFLIFGDIQDDGQVFNTTCGTMLDCIRSNPALQTISLQLGDCVGGDGNSEDDWDTTVFGNKGTFSNVTKYLASVPMNPARGNHDDIAFQLKYFPANKPFYGFDYGPIHFIFIDTEDTYTPGSEQYTVIESELANTNAKWKIPMFHRPGWSTGENRGQENVRTYLHPLFKQYGVRVVYMAHNHHFSYVLVDGINYMTLGPVGAGTKPVKQNQNMIIKSYVVRHFNYVQVRGNTLEHSIVEHNTGRVLDKFTLSL
jgi:hypothetical protein